MPSNIREMMEALREAIGKATPGEWEHFPLRAWYADERLGVQAKTGLLVASCGIAGNEYSLANARYIALANPQTLTLLLQQVERLEGALEPFVAVAEHDIGEREADEDMFRPMMALNVAPRLTVGHFRKARAALSGDAP